MKRSGFAKKTYERKQVTLYKPNRWKVPQKVENGKPVPKDAPVRHEGYRRLVAALPCAWCGIEGYSNHAHMGGLAQGKGRGIKVDDRLAAPLCCERPLVNGCHMRFDQTTELSKQKKLELMELWVKQTQQTILESGKWPLNLPLMEWRD